MTTIAKLAVSLVSDVGGFVSGMKKAASQTTQFATQSAASMRGISAAADVAVGRIESLTGRIGLQNSQLGILRRELATAAAKYGESSIQAQKKQLAIDRLTASIAANQSGIARNTALIESEVQAQIKSAQAATQSSSAMARGAQAARDAASAKRGLASSAESAGGSLQRISFGAMAAASALGNLTANFISGAISGLMRLGSAAVSAARQLVGEALESTASYERLGMSLTTLIQREMQITGATGDAGEKSKELLGWITQLAIKSPFTQEGVAQALRQAMAYGFTADESKRLTEAMINFAAGSGASEDTMQRIALALGQIKAKGKLAGQEVLQLTEAGLNVNDILARSFGKSTEEIVAMREQGLIPADMAIEAITKTLETDFAGAAERQAGSLAGLMSSMEDIKSVGLREFFGGMFTSIQPLLAAFVDKVSDPKFMGALSKIGDVLGAGLASVLPTAEQVGNFLDKLVLAVNIFSGALELGKSPLEAFRLALDVLAPPELRGTIDGIFAAIQTGSAILAQIQSGDFSFFTDSLETAGQAIWDSFSPELQAGLLTARTVLEAIGNAIVMTLTPSFTALAEAIKPVWEQFQPFIGPIIGGAFAVIGAIILALIGIVVGLANGIAGAVTVALNNLDTLLGAWGATFASLGAYLSGFVEFWRRVFAGDIPGAIEIGIANLRNLGSFIANLFSTIVLTISGAIQIMLALVGGFIEGVIDFFTNLYNELVGQSIIPDLLADMLAFFTTGLTDVINTIVTFIGDAVGKFKEFAADFIQLGIDMANNMILGILQMAGQLAEVAYNVVSGAVKSAAEALGGAAQAAAGAFGGNQSSGATGSSTPKFQHGGLVNAPHSGMNVTVHGLEAIIPLRGGAIPVELTGGAGGGITIYGDLNVSMEGGEADLTTLVRRIRMAAA